LWEMYADGSSPHQLFSRERGVVDYGISHDGSQLAITAFHGDLSADIWLTDSEGQNPRQITNCGAGICSNPVWSPDGALIAYQFQDATSGTPGASRIWLYNVQTGESAPVFEDNQVLGYLPQWSPDGSRLAFFDGNIQAIHVVEIGTGADAQFHNQMGEVGSLSPDGKSIAYSDIREVDGNYYSQLLVGQLDGSSEPAPLIPQAEEDQSPSWSPDGNWVAFSRRLLNRGYGFSAQFALLNVQSGEVQVPPQDTAFTNHSFIWDPSSKQLIIERFNLTIARSTQELWLYDLRTGSFTLLVQKASQGQWLP